jgi:integrase
MAAFYDPRFHPDADPGLSAAAMRMAGAAREVRVQKAYTREFRKYLSWMAANRLSQWWAYPGQAILMMYLVWLVTVDLDCDSKVKPATGYTYLQHVSASVQDYDLPCPLKTEAGRPMMNLAKVYKGLKKRYGADVKHKLAISTDIARPTLRCPVFDPGSHDGRMLRAALLLALVMGLRVSEFTSPKVGEYSEMRTLCIRNVAFGVTRGGARYAEVNIEYAKNSLFREGFRQKVWEDSSDICPYTALADYMSRWEGPTKGGPVFRCASGRFLTRHTFTAALRDGLDFAGFRPDKYSAHSLRAGAAVSVSAAGYGADVIKAQGRWFSSAYEAYLSYTDDFLREVQIKMTRTTTAARMGVIGTGSTTEWADAPWVSE